MGVQSIRQNCLSQVVQKPYMSLLLAKYPAKNQEKKWKRYKKTSEVYILV